MMQRSDIDAQMIFDYEERKHSLLADGYRIRYESILMNGVMCRLHHMCNGNDIILKAIGHTLTQLTNRVQTHVREY